MYSSIAACGDILYSKVGGDLGVQFISYSTSLLSELLTCSYTAPVMVNSFLPEVVHSISENSKSELLPLFLNVI